MSYINDALRKAQREKENRYERFGGIITSCPDGLARPRNRRTAIVAAVALTLLISTGILVAVYVLQQPLPVTTGISAPAAAEAPAALPSAVPPAVKQVAPEAVYTGAAPEGTKSQKAVIPKRGVPAAVQVGGKPVRSGDAASIKGAPFPRDAEVLYKEALSAQRRGNAKESEVLYKRVLSLDPGHVRALNNLGVLCMERKNSEQAIAFFNKAIVLKKDYVDPYYNLACLYARKSEINESLSYMKVAADIDGNAINWAQKDADMKNVVASPEFKKIMEEQKN
jgi:tetratricopeptide (TPR) repeat protein